MTTLDKIRQLDRELDWLKQKACQHPEHLPIEYGKTHTCPACGQLTAKENERYTG
jgi:hypothetical protein